MNERQVVRLSGCTPVPLAGYLKSLAVLRLVAKRDTDARGWWEGDEFCLRSGLSVDDLLEYLLSTYEPTPIVAPWNGGSGFYEKDSQQARLAIASSSASRLGVYRKTIRMVEKILTNLGIEKKPEKTMKRRLVERCRALLPDEAVEWLDTVILLTADDLAFPALLGTGGNDGRLEFTNNFMQRVCELFDVKSGRPAPLSGQWLRASLFQDTVSGLVDAAVGQFNPGAVGGPNARAGFEGNSRVNPWDYVLTMEGALAFSASASRRLSTNAPGTLSFPFTVFPSGIGYSSQSKGDREDARSEMWMPIWKRPTTYREIAFIFREGRAQVNGRMARDGLDFARACAGLGIDRGIDSFQRYSFLMRSGKAYLSVPLTRFPVRDRGHANLINEIDPWLRRLNMYVGGKTTPESFGSALRVIEERIYDLCLRPGAPRVQELLIALGRMERLMRFSPDAREAVFPLYLDGSEWVKSARDGSPEFAIALALAGMRDLGGAGALRLNLSPIDPDSDLEERPRWDPVAGRNLPPRVAWSERSLSGNLVQILHRRSLDQQIYRKKASDGSKRGFDKPYNSLVAASVDDVARFLEGGAAVDDKRISDLLWGCILFKSVGRLVGSSIAALRANDRVSVIPWAYVVLKLVFTPDHILREIFHQSPEWELPIPDTLWGLLQSNTEEGMEKAVMIAERRLRASGLGVRNTTGRVVCTSGYSPERLAAALAIPISGADTSRLVRIVCHEDAWKDVENEKGVGKI